MVSAGDVATEHVATGLHYKTCVVRHLQLA
jgi:hypothetical protein